MGSPQSAPARQGREISSIGDSRTFLQYHQHHLPSHQPLKVVSKKVFLLVLPVEGESQVKVLAWNYHTKKKIYEKSHSGVNVDTAVVDHHNKEVLLGFNTRLVIEDETVTEINQIPLPGVSGQFIKELALELPPGITVSPCISLPGGFKFTNNFTVSMYKVVLPREFAPSVTNLSVR